MIDLAKIELIGISGKQYAGKDTLAAILMERFPRYQKTPLAFAIKQAFAQEQGITIDEIDANKGQYRPGLIAKGDWGRAQDLDYWIKQVFAVPGAKIVSDVRMKREYELLRQAGALMIRINADRDERAKRGTLVSEHDKTELELDEITDWDWVIENNQSIDDLKAQLLSKLQ